MIFPRVLRNIFDMHRRLFDTNLLIWYVLNDDRLSSDIQADIERLDSGKHISIVSAWEVAIKISIGKLNLRGGVDAFWDTFVLNGFKSLPVSIDALKIVETLPFHHKDPFDRLLLATAQVHGLEFITTDPTIAKYF